MPQPVKKVSWDVAESHIENLFSEVANMMNLPKIDLQNLGEDNGIKRMALQSGDNVLTYTYKQSESSWGSSKRLDFSYDGEQGRLQIECKSSPEDSECTASGSKNLMDNILSLEEM